MVPCGSAIFGASPPNVIGGRAQVLTFNLRSPVGAQKEKVGNRLHSVWDRNLKQEGKDNGLKNRISNPK